MTIAVAFAAILVAWASLLGTAWMCRWRGAGLATSIGAVSCCYAGLSALALLCLGWTWNGLLGAAGMSLPFALAVVLVVIKPTQRLLSSARR